MARLRDRRPSPPPVRRSVRGITIDDFNRWRRDPVTQMVLAYCLDFRDEKIAQGKDAFMAISLTREDMIGLSTAASLYEQMAHIEFGDIVDFYAQAQSAADVREAKRVPVPEDLRNLPPVVGEEEEEDDECTDHDGDG